MEPLGPLTHLGRYRLVRPLGRRRDGRGVRAPTPRGSTARWRSRPSSKSHLLDSETLTADYSARFMREARPWPGWTIRTSCGCTTSATNPGGLHRHGFVHGRELAQTFAAGERFDLPTVVRLMDRLCSGPWPSRTSGAWCP